MQTGLDFNDVLIVPQTSFLKSRSEPDLSSHNNGYIPIMCANMTSVATVKMAAALHENKFMSALHKFYTNQQLTEYFLQDSSRLNSTFITYGMEKDAIERAISLSENLGAPIKNICLDVANGYQYHFLQQIEEFAKAFPSARLMAGNIVTSEGVRSLSRAGANIIKVGIGSGAACLTRKMTGVGYPQFSAVLECAQTALELDVSVCSDGGHVVVGDICKAFVGGASYVMLGSMLAGHAECSESGDDQKIPYYGMSSDFANEQFAGGLKSYRTSEGRQLYLDNRGPVKNTLVEIEGGIRSCMTYIGASSLVNMYRASVVKVNSQLNRSLEKYE